MSELKEMVRVSLEDGKAQDVVIINLEGKTDIADYMVIASGTSSKHASSLAQNLVEKLKAQDATVLSTEGMVEGNWVLVDAGDVVVHIFRPEVRELYNLEKMWSVPLPEVVVAN